MQNENILNYFYYNPKRDDLIFNRLLRPKSSMLQNTDVIKD